MAGLLVTDAVKGAADGSDVAHPPAMTSKGGWGMGRYAIGLGELDRTRWAIGGGKGANLGELSRMEGISVPPGFCVTTAAYRRCVGAIPGMDALLDALARMETDDRRAIGDASAAVRDAIATAAIPDDVANEIHQAYMRMGSMASCAVRSSATAEDLPDASFAGQQDSYLDIVGASSILEHVRRCWASLFTERAVSYRVRHGLDHEHVSMAVVVQRMVQPRASGMLFTADPISGHRKVSVIEAVRGLGDALASGSRNADSYRVRGGHVTHSPTAETPALTDVQVIQLSNLGRRIEAHFGSPQDIEWCLDGDGFHVVQSRPITTLFPIPARDDGERHLYISVGHQQMMTDAMRMLGISVHQLAAGTPMYEAGGRLFVDVARTLASPATRERLLTLSRSDPLIGDALASAMDRDDILPPPGDPPSPVTPPPGGEMAPIATDPSIVAELTEHCERSISTLESEIVGRTGVELVDFILSDFQEMKRILFDPLGSRVIMAGMEAAWWLDERMEEWLGERGVAGVLAQSVEGNVTSRMGLDLMDVADAIRPHAEVVTLLERARELGDDRFMDELAGLPGYHDAYAAIQSWLDRYGMRCVGEIDITRPRWSERPTMILPILLGDIRSFAPGEAARKFARGSEQAARKRDELLERLRALPDGERKAAETERMIDRLRAFSGYREYPKYGMVRRYYVHRQALLREADRLVQARVLRNREDIHHLTLQEVREVTRTGQVDEQLIRDRKAAFQHYQALTPPRVMTSEGESLVGSYRREGMAAGSLPGLGVSAGMVEGRARVVLDINDAELGPGDILVTRYADPSWTPLFVQIAGLVTEVGGLMTHGSVIAREYGLPAVVGVVRATELIRDGELIRVNGTEGFVEPRPSPPSTGPG